MMKLNSISKPHAKPTVNSLTPAIGEIVPLTELTQFTIKTGAVCNFEATAKVAPVSLTLRVKTMIAPERIEYFVIGQTIVRKTAKGLAPKFLLLLPCQWLFAPLPLTLTAQSTGK